MPFFIPASIILPALAKTTAEVSGWLILEYCTLGSVGTVGVLYYAGAFNKLRNFTPLQIEETPLHQFFLLIQDAMLRTNESICRLCEILEEVKGHEQQIDAENRLRDEVCQSIRFLLKEIGNSMDLIRQLFQELTEALGQDNVIFSQTLKQMQSLEKILEEVKSQAFDKIQCLEAELEAKDKTIRNFFEVNQVLKEKISSLRQTTLSN